MGLTESNSKMHEPPRVIGYITVDAFAKIRFIISSTTGFSFSFRRGARF
jgi:hypothetical protein